MTLPLYVQFGKIIQKKSKKGIDTGMKRVYIMQARVKTGARFGRLLKNFLRKCKKVLDKA